MGNEKMTNIYKWMILMWQTYLVKCLVFDQILFIFNIKQPNSIGKHICRWLLHSSHKILSYRRKHKHTFHSVTYASSNQWNTGRKTKMLLQEIKDFGRSRFEKSKDLFGYSKWSREINCSTVSFKIITIIYQAVSSIIFWKCSN